MRKPIINAKPATSTKAAKASTAIVPVAADKAPSEATQAKQAATAKRNETFSAARAFASTLYAGASTAVHASNRTKPLALYLAHVAKPVQKAASETDRDASALAVAFKHCDKANTFNPTEYGADLGAISRLSSLGFLAVAGERIGLTTAGLTRARAIKA